MNNYNTNYDNIPDMLKDTGRFCTWGYRMRDGKHTKIPYNPVTGSKSKSNDKSTFGSFNDAVNTQQKNPTQYYGIGLGIFDNLVGIDIDNCVSEDGTISDLALDVLDMIDSYAEISPSNHGIHIYCYAKNLQYDTENYYIKNSKLGIEMYIAGSTNRYLTVTGNSVNNKDVTDCTESIQMLAEKYMRRSGIDSNTAKDDCDNEGSSILSDAEVISKMISSSKGESIRNLWEGNYDDSYPSQSEAELALCNHLAFWTRKDKNQIDRLFRQSGLYREKWDRQQSGTTYGNITISKAIKGCTSVYTPGYRPVKTSDIESALDFLRSVDVAHNPRYPRNDIGEGYLLADYLKPFARPIAGSNYWATYDGIKWNLTHDMSIVEEATKCLAKALTVYATEGCNDSEVQEFITWANKWNHRAKRRNIIQDASSVYPVDRSEFDNNPWLLNVNNGTIDLSKYPYQLKDHDPDDLISQLAPVDYIPEETCERWNQFIEEIMEPGEDETELDGKDKAQFFQRYIGYCLTGDTKEESFIVMYGATSRNGKSVCVESVKSIMGTYSKTVNADTLILAKARNSSSPSEDIARLVGVRMASVGELPENARFDSARIKSLTGNDEITARYLGENSFQFHGMFKLILHTNHLPQCTDMSLFNSGRVLVIPFSRHFEPWEQDKSLKQLFRNPSNQSGILNWLLEGLHQYQTIGLNPPAVVTRYTNSYKSDNDKISMFKDECLEETVGYKEPTSSIYRRYQTWCKSNGFFYESASKFNRALESHGLIITKAKPSFGGNATTCILDVVCRSACDF